MRRRFALAAALPALVSLAAMALVADRLSRRALEGEVSGRLVAAAKTAAAALPADRVAHLRPGDERTRTYGHVRARLDPVARATGTRLVVLRPDGTALADTAGRVRIGERVPALERDRLEIAQAAHGHPTASQVMFEDLGGHLHKTGYAPVIDPEGRVVAVVGADGTAPSFETLRGFRRTLATFAVAGALLGALVAALAALTVTRPLVRITEAARRIARGDLVTPLWRRKRRDEIGTLRDTIEEMRRALRARDEERETLLAGIAHEVRNPLGALDLFAGLLAEEIAARPDAAPGVPDTGRPVPPPMPYGLEGTRETGLEPGAGHRMRETGVEPGAGHRVPVAGVAPAGSSAVPDTALPVPDTGLRPLPSGETDSDRCSAATAYVTRIRAELASLSKIVEEFLDYARARPPVREDVDLAQLLGEVSDLAQPLAAERDVSLSIEGAGKARADREQVRRAALNLVRNAVEAAPAGSVVEIAARTGDGEAAIEVADRGAGLSPEARDRLFRPFFTTKERGTGLGLALAKKVADAHGGALSLDDRAGGGTVARLALPVERS